MMARRSLLLALLLAACNDGRNYVVVSVASISSFSGVTTLHVDVANNGQTGSVDVAVPTGSQPSDPFTFSLEFDPTRTGSVGIGIEARNSAGSMLATGSTTTTLVKGIAQAALTLEQLPAPTALSLTPFRCDYPRGGAQTTVNGLNFVSGSRVLWGGTPLNTEFLSDRQVRVTAPSGIDNTDVDVSVRNPDGQTSNSLKFYYRADPVLNCP